MPPPEIATDPAAAEALDARGVLGVALRSLGRDRLAIASSFGAEDVVLIDLLASLEPRPRVFTLDTGRLPQETYDLMDQVRRRYAIDIEVFFPDAERVQGVGEDIARPERFDLGGLQDELRWHRPAPGGSGSIVRPC